MFLCSRYVVCHRLILACQYFLLTLGYDKCWFSGADKHFHQKGPENCGTAAGARIEAMKALTGWI
jgi:hypothetical protein